MTTTTAYEAGPVKRRRRTNAELEQLDEAIITAVRMEHPVTVRGVYYRCVSAGAIDKTEHGYDVIVRQLGKLREAGRIPYEWVSDGSRIWHGVLAYNDAEEAVRDTAQFYRRMMWQDMPDRIIILSEKDAITGVISPVTDELQVPLGIVRGYSSITFCWQIAAEINRNARAGHRTYVYQLGDHDPSGVDAWRALQQRVTDFLEPTTESEFRRIAVTAEQILELGLQTRPTKKSDTRAAGFDGESVEVDAIAPTALRSIVRDAIEAHIDTRILDMHRQIEASERELLNAWTIGGAA